MNAVVSLKTAERKHQVAHTHTYTHSHTHTHTHTHTLGNHPFRSKSQSYTVPSASVYVDCHACAAAVSSAGCCCSAAGSAGWSPFVWGGNVVRVKDDSDLEGADVSGELLGDECKGAHFCGGDMTINTLSRRQSAMGATHTRVARASSAISSALSAMSAGFNLAQALHWLERSTHVRPSCYRSSVYLWMPVLNRGKRSSVESRHPLTHP